MKNNFNSSFKLGVLALFFTAFVVLAPETSANFMDTVKGWFIKENKEDVKVEMLQENSATVAAAKNLEQEKEVVTEESLAIDLIEPYEKEYGKTEDIYHDGDVQGDEADDEEAAEDEVDEDEVDVKEAYDDEAHDEEFHDENEETTAAY